MKRGTPTDLDRRLADLRLEQRARRANYDLDLVELDELRACKQLAYRLFGDRGVVEFECNPITRQRVGSLMLGYFTEPRGPRHLPPNPHRRRLLLFKAASHRELVDQVTRWKAATGEAGGK